MTGPTFKTYEMELDIITRAEFSYKDVIVYQDGVFVVLRNEQILQLAEKIKDKKEGLKDEKIPSDFPSDL